MDIIVFGFLCLAFNNSIIIQYGTITTSGVNNSTITLCVSYKSTYVICGMQHLKKNDTGGLDLCLAINDTSTTLSKFNLTVYNHVDSIGISYLCVGF